MQAHRSQTSDNVPFGLKSDFLRLKNVKLVVGLDYFDFNSLLLWLGCPQLCRWDVTIQTFFQIIITNYHQTFIQTSGNTRYCAGLQVGGHGTHLPLLTNAFNPCLPCPYTMPPLRGK
eukprot:scaffold182366_cov20-Tisochrysis_lutea.AAC.2